VCDARGSQRANEIRAERIVHGGIVGTVESGEGESMSESNGTPEDPDAVDAPARSPARRQYGIEDELPKDGRVARAVRTRRAVADAMLALIDEGDLRPTSKAIAERAGVSERTIFQHFADLEALFGVAAERIGELIGSHVVKVPQGGDFETRLAAFVHEIAYLNEAMTFVRRASRLHEPYSPVLQEALRRMRVIRKRVGAKVFAPELAAIGDPVERERTANAIALLSLWSSWENMRAHLGLDRAEARATLKHGLRTLLGQPRPAHEAPEDPTDPRLGDEAD
jgi:AcrR family transcriptional regulator